MITISSPADEDTIRGLKLGQTVYITGTVITGRDKMHMRAVSYKDAPDELNNATLFHCGPIMVRDGNIWKAVAAGPTTSARMNRFGAEMISRFKIRMIIGQGGMSDDILDAMRETGCVYLAAIGGAAVSLADCLAYEDVKWEDLGMAEAMWRFTAERLGPLVVAMDAHGNSLYKNVSSKVSGTIKGHF